MYSYKMNDDFTSYGKKETNYSIITKQIKELLKNDFFVNGSQVFCAFASFIIGLVVLL